MCHRTVGATIIYRNDIKSESSKSRYLLKRVQTHLGFVQEKKKKRIGVARFENKYDMQEIKVMRQMRYIKDRSRLRLVKRRRQMWS